MAKGAQIGCKRKARNKVRLENDGSDESDEDYKVSDDEEFEESEDEYCSSLVGDESEENSGEFFEEEDEWIEKKVKKVGRPKARKGQQVRKKQKIVKPRKRRARKEDEEEEEDDDYDDYEDDDFSDLKQGKKNKAFRKKEEDDDTDFLSEEDDEFVQKKPKKLARASRAKASRNSDYKNPRKKNQVSCVAESDNDDENDVEFTPESITRRTRAKKQIVMRQNRSDMSKEFNDEKPTTVNKKKRTERGRGRRRKFSVNSDSDIASSGSSDYEYTISEEEREQIREASGLCRGVSTSLRSSCPLRINNEETQTNQPAKKGKEKVLDMKIEASKRVCGICLSEEGKRTIRGILNCCDHYFCFACIMEWSKVESRCPLCKQRFTILNRKVRADGGHDSRDAVFGVPERDQVYQPSEEELMGYLDPYESVICSECHLGGDDALMLLCDLCDSPAHTYCVGLGHEVPDGNWYCDGCRPTANASSNPQAVNPAPDHGTVNNFFVGSSPLRPTVRETFDLNEAYVPDTQLTQVPGHSQSPRFSIADRQSSLFASGYLALTVFERRRIQRQIQHFLTIRGRRNERNESTAPVSGISLFGSRISPNGAVSARPNVVQESIMPHNINVQGRSNYNSSLFLGGEVSSSRPSGLRGQALPSEASTSVNLSYVGFATGNEVLGSNGTSGAGFVHHQLLHPCSSRSNNGSDATTTPHEIREGTVPSSRTLQGFVYSHHF